MTLYNQNKRIRIMKKSIISMITVIAALVITHRAQGQQDPHFTLFNFNMNVINPAYAGAQETPELSVLYRSQWIGVDDSPRTGTFIYSRGLGNNLGLAVTAINDRVFVLDQTDLAVDLSYRLQMGQETDLYFGMKLGGGFVNIDLARANAPGNDPLFSQNQSFFNPHVGAGLYINNPKFFITLSTPNFLNGDRYEKTGNVPTAAIEHMHLYLGGGYNFELNENLVLTPRFMVRTVEGAPASYDVGSSLLINDKITAGVNYRIDETYSIYGLINVYDRFQLGVSYDITDQASLINDDGSLEFILKYQFKK